MSFAIASLILAAPQAQQGEFVKEFFATATDKKQTPVSRQLALLTLGRIGRRVDLTQQSAIFNGVFQLIYDQSEARDEIRVYAAKAFGGIASANIERSLPLITSQI